MIPVAFDRFEMIYDLATFDASVVVFIDEEGFHDNEDFLYIQASVHTGEIGGQTYRELSGAPTKSVGSVDSVYVTLEYTEQPANVFTNEDGEEIRLHPAITRMVWIDRVRKATQSSTDNSKQESNGRVVDRVHEVP